MQNDYQQGWTREKRLWSTLRLLVFILYTNILFGFCNRTMCIHSLHVFFEPCVLLLFYVGYVKTCMLINVKSVGHKCYRNPLVLIPPSNHENSVFSSPF